MDAEDAEAVPWSAHHLGTYYEREMGVAQSYKKAAELYRLAADHGHAEAAVNLGNLFCNDKGVVQRLSIGSQTLSIGGRTSKCRRTEQSSQRVSCGRRAGPELR